MQSLIEFQNNRRLEKKLKTAIESDEKWPRRQSGIVVEAKAEKN